MDIYPDGRTERGTERQVFTVSAGAAAPVDEKRRLREEADKLNQQAESEDAARRALQADADKTSDAAEKDQAEMERIRSEADTLLGEKH